MGWGWGWRPYVSVAERRAKAAREMERLRRKGLNVQPVELEGRTIARTFWGKAWCDHLEGFSDYENRLPRGRTYVRNGSVCHLDIQEGRIRAKVSGSELYDVSIAIKTMPPARWSRLKGLCTGKVGSALELLQGRLSDQVMSVVTDQAQGLFPSPREIDIDCSCPDWADMCKHVAAVLYGTGSRLDESPELLFRLRGVDPLELVSEASVKAVVKKVPARRARILGEEKLAEVFGIDLAPPGPTAGRAAAPTAEMTRVRRVRVKEATTRRSRSPGRKPRPALRAGGRSRKATKPPRP